jgi:YesN/AraC family two-component response regulator
MIEDLRPNQQSSIINPGDPMLRVLLVEDNRIFREAFKQSLCELIPSMVIDEAANSEEALQRINATPPHLIFIDIRLPGMNGLQLTKKIKQDFPNIHVAIMTGYDMPEYRQAALQYGADLFLAKGSLKWDEVETLVKSIPPDISNGPEKR